MSDGIEDHVNSAIMMILTAPEMIVAQQTEIRRDSLGPHEAGWRSAQTA